MKQLSRYLTSIKRRQVVFSLLREGEGDQLTEVKHGGPDLHPGLRKTREGAELLPYGNRASARDPDTYLLLDCLHLLCH